MKYKDQVSTAQKMKFSIKNFFSKCDQIRRKLQILLHLSKKSLMKYFISCAVQHLFVQSRQLKHQNKIWNMFKFKNKDARATQLTGKGLYEEI